MPELFCFNTDFDFSLSASPDLLARISEVSRRKEMLFWCLGQKERRFICHSQEPPPAYREQLAHYGLEPLIPATTDEDYSAFKARPWGYNQEALGQFAQYGLIPAHPDLTVVKRVNSRQFSFTIAQKNNLLLPHSCLVNSFAELLDRIGSFPLPLVVKPVFGNAGIGLTFIEKRPLSLLQEEELKQAFFQGGGAAIIEPWLSRVDDFSTYFYLHQDGRLENFSIQRCLVGRSGSFYGMLIDPGQRLFRESLLRQTAQTVASALHELSYFGPVVIDGYSYQDGQGRLGINPLVEINARETMGLIARHLQQQINPDGAILFRLARRKRCLLPDTIGETEQLLGKKHYQAGATSGVAILTPLAAALPRAKVLQNLFAVIGQDSKECLDQLAMLEGLVLKTKEPTEIIQQFSLL